MASSLLESRPEAARWVAWRSAAAAAAAGDHRSEAEALTVVLRTLLPRHDRGVRLEDAREAVRAGERAVPAAAAAGEPVPLAWAWLWLGVANLALGDCDEAIRAIGEALDLAESEGARLPAAWARLMAARALTRGVEERGELAVRAAEAAREIASLDPGSEEEATELARLS